MHPLTSDGFRIQMYRLTKLAVFDHPMTKSWLHIFIFYVMWIIHFDGHPLKYNGGMSKYINVMNWKCTVRIFIIGWSNLLNFPCLHIGILKQSYGKICGNYIIPGIGRKCQLGKIPIEINSNITVDLGCHSPNMEIGYQICNNASNFTMLGSKYLYLSDLLNVSFNCFTFLISTEIDGQGHLKVISRSWNTSFFF